MIAKSAANNSHKSRSWPVNIRECRAAPGDSFRLRTIGRRSYIDTYPDLLIGLLPSERARRLLFLAKGKESARLMSHVIGNVAEKKRRRECASTIDKFRRGYPARPSPAPPPPSSPVNPSPITATLSYPNDSIRRLSDFLESFAILSNLFIRRSMERSAKIPRSVRRERDLFSAILAERRDFLVIVYRIIRRPARPIQRLGIVNGEGGGDPHGTSGTPRGELGSDISLSRVPSSVN